MFTLRKIHPAQSDDVIRVPFWSKEAEFRGEDNLNKIVTVFIGLYFLGYR